MENVIVLGSGPAGLTAALYLARANLNPLVIAGGQPGGQLMTTTDVENFPGFPEGIQGPELMNLMMKQVERFGARLKRADADQVTLDIQGQKHIVKVGDESYETRSLVVATGADAIWLGLESEQRLRGKGVSACATCDGFFFRGKEIAVVGGGDTAMEEALFLTKFATKVYVIHRRDTLRASQIMQERAKANEKISFIWNSEIAEVLGDEQVSGVALRDTKSGKLSELAIEGLFLAIGHRPNTDLFKTSGLELDEKGYLKAEYEVHTKVPGVFIAGDVADHEFRQAVTAAGAGCKAAIIAERYLSSLE